MGKLVLIDQDIVAFSSACAAEKRFYQLSGAKYRTKKELYEATLGTSTPKPLDRSRIDAELEVVVEPEPASHARQNARMLLQSILDACAPVKEYRGYLTGPGNFRYKLATIQPYKGNRKESSKPVWLGEVRKFLKDECATEEVCGVEADDKLAVEFLKDPSNTLLASKDKDFRQLPNLTMWTWQTKEFITATPVEANRSFWKQVLTGDATDSILGCKGIGDAKAEKLLGSVTNEKLMLTVVYAEYMKVYGKEAWKHMQENCRLLWLCRTEQDLLEPEKAWVPIHTPGGVNAT